MEDKQRNNCFFTRCLVNNKMCSLVIDRKYWINMASTIMVEKFQLSVLKYPKSYILCSLDDPEFKDMTHILVERERDVGNFWPTITPVPSSKLFCVVTCWNSSDIFQYTNISSISHEGNQGNEELSPSVGKLHFVNLFQYINKSSIFLSEFLDGLLYSPSLSNCFKIVL